MISVTITDYTMIIAFWLCFTRWLAIMFQLPIFNHTSIPSIVKVLATLLITFCFFPITKVEVMKDIQYLGVDNFWALTMFHTIVGIAIGYLVKSIMSVYTAAGTIITQQIGFGSVSYFDPSIQSKVGPFEKMINWTVLIMILSTGALLPMFKGVLQSFFVFLRSKKMQTSIETY